MLRPWVLILALLAASCDLITNPEHCATAGLAARLEGHVTSFDGVPQPGIAITLGVNDQAVTDANGAFFFSSLTARNYPITTTNDKIYGDIQISPGRNEVRIVVVTTSFTGYTSGRILDACTRKPIGGATIGPGFHTVITGADGTYNRSACCNTELGVTVSAPGYKSQPFSGFRISGRTRYQDVLMQRE